MLYSLFFHFTLLFDSLKILVASLIFLLSSVFRLLEDEKKLKRIKDAYFFPLGSLIARKLNKRSLDVHVFLKNYYIARLIEDKCLRITNKSRHIAVMSHVLRYLLRKQNKMAPSQDSLDEVTIDN